MEASDAAFLDVAQKHGPRRPLLDFKRLGHGLRQQTPVRERGELHQPYTVGKHIGQPARHFDRQARLARTPGPGQGNQPLRRDELPELRESTAGEDDSRPTLAVCGSRRNFR